MRALLRIVLLVAGILATGGAALPWFPHGAPYNTYIVIVRNGENEAGWPGARARIIHWHLEPHVAYSTWAGVAET